MYGDKPFRAKLNFNELEQKIMDSSVANLKQELISLSKSTDAGCNCTPEQAHSIETRAKFLEDLSPTIEPTNQMEKVCGRWQLLYSTLGLERETTLARLSFGKLPNVPVSVTGIFQEIDSVNQHYNNLIEFTVASGVQGIVLVNGRYTIENSKRLNIDFLETSVHSAANDLKFAALCSALEIDNQSMLSETLSFSGWSEITYLDENLRLMRGNQQNLYVLVRVN